eukprot:1146395-Pelagomonas_calceolata.AAC.1
MRKQQLLHSAHAQLLRGRRTNKQPPASSPQSRTATNHVMAPKWLPDWYLSSLFIHHSLERNIAVILKLTPISVHRLPGNKDASISLPSGHRTVSAVSCKHANCTCTYLPTLSLCLLMMGLPQSHPFEPQFGQSALLSPPQNPSFAVPLMNRHCLGCNGRQLKATSKCSSSYEEADIPGSRPGHPMLMPSVMEQHLPAQARSAITLSVGGLSPGPGGNPVGKIKIAAGLSTLPIDGTRFYQWQWLNGSCFF